MPPALRGFLLALAVIDDLLAVLVIALFYGGKIVLVPLIAAGLILVLLVVCNRLRVRFISIYLLLGLGLWLAVLASGFHATLAGVLLAFTIPLETTKRPSPLIRLEHALQPWVTFIILPLLRSPMRG